jgi:hypothetical protein
MEQPPPPAWLPETRYQLLRKLGAGGMGEVWLATDRERGNEVAVKRMRFGADAPETQSDRLRFKREFLVLSQLDHPGIVKVFDFGESGEDLYYTMEHVAGWPLQEYLAGGHWLAPPDPSSRYFETAAGLARVWKIAEEALAILASLHARALVHRDLKPDNLLVDESGTVRLIDFGLAKDTADAARLTQTGGVVGTPSYLSPEQIRAQPLDGRADLYALGVILYELTTGALPFRGNSVSSVLQAHLQQAAAAPRERNARIKPLHSALILRLLAKEPSGRPASALETLRLLREAGEHSSQAGENTMTRSLNDATGAAPPPPELLIAPYTGNVAARAAVLEVCDRLLRGDGGALLIGGPQGSGKSRLGDEARAFAADHGFTVWAGAARSEGALAGQLFQGLFAAAMLERQPAAMAQWLGEEGPVLALDFPALRRLPGLEAVRPPALEPAAERERLLRAMHQFFSRAARQGPLLLLLEDLQWADPLSLELTAHLLNNFTGGAATGQPQLLLIASHHDDAAALAGGLGGWLDRLAGARVKRLTLQPLARDELARLLGAALGSSEPAPEAFAQRLHELTGGNPFFALETVKAQIAEGKLARGADGGWDYSGWLARARKGGDTPALAGGLDSALRRRLEGLPDEAREALRAAALMGRQFAFAWWPAVAELNEGKLLDIADRAIRQGILLEGDNEQLRFAHDLLRAALIQELSGLRKRRMHGKIVEAIEAGGEVDAHIELLAEHALEAKLADEAPYYVIRAAEKLIAQSQLEAAGDYLERLAGLYPQPEKMNQGFRLKMLMHQLTVRELGGAAIDSALVGQALAVATALGDETAAKALQAKLG